MRRQKMSRRSSKRAWKRGVKRVHSMNNRSSSYLSRGGIRL